MISALRVIKTSQTCPESTSTNSTNSPSPAEANSSPGTSGDNNHVINIWSHDLGGILPLGENRTTLTVPLCLARLAMNFTFTFPSSCTTFHTWWQARSRDSIRTLHGTCTCSDLLQQEKLTLMSLSAPPVTSLHAAPLRWKSALKTGSLLCHTICGVVTFIPSTLSRQQRGLVDQSG